MPSLKFISTKQRLWTEENPSEAFKRVLAMIAYAEQLLKYRHHEQALPYLGSAYETTQVIFKCVPSSPQLTTTMTSNAIMLADAYKETFQHNESMHVLECTHARLQSDIAKQPIFCTRVAFFKHCADLLKQAMGELEMIKNWEIFYINTNKSNYHLH